MRLFLLSVGLLFTLSLFGQSADYEVPDNRRWNHLKIDAKNGVKSVLHAYAGPARWKKRDWLMAGGIALGTFGLFLVDEDLHPRFTQYNDRIPDFIQKPAFYFGKPAYNYGLTASIYTLGLLTKNEKIRKTGILLIASATTAGLIQTVSKTALGRARPSAFVGNGVFDFFSPEPNFHSFPSGHTVLAVVTAHALARSTDKIWLKAGIYTLGAITPVSRLWTNAHWLSDVGLSVALSIVSVDSVYNYLERTGDYASKKITPGISWKVRAGASSVGLFGTF